MSGGAEGVVPSYHAVVRIRSTDFCPSVVSTSMCVSSAMLEGAARRSGKPTRAHGRSQENLIAERLKDETRSRRLRKVIKAAVKDALIS